MPRSDGQFVCRLVIPYIFIRLTGILQVVHVVFEEIENGTPRRFAITATDDEVGIHIADLLDEVVLVFIHRINERRGITRSVATLFLAIDPNYHQIEKRISRGRQYYSVNGKGKYNKGKCALEVVKLYISDHPSATWSQLVSTFNTRVYNYISLKEEVEEREQKSNDRSNTRRWFKDNPLHRSDGQIFYVTTQVGTGCPTNFEDIVKLAGELNYKIEEL